MEDFAINIPDPKDGCDVWFDMQARTQGKMGTVELMLNLLSVHIDDSVFPFLICWRRLHVGHSTAEMNVWPQVEVATVRPKILHILRQSDMIGSIQWETMVQECC